ncbi:MAG: peptidase, partial [Gemmatimonadota bacterium]|nr:peptidase [Gemmatimonadota bacterium]
VASKYREEFLFNIYRMGKNSIERGSRDTWTLTPKRVDAVKQAVERNRTAKIVATPAQYVGILQDAVARDPRGYVIRSDQKDFATAVKFINALVKNGVTVHRATTGFGAAGKSYPAGSYVVMTAQAFRPHVLDMFEPQNHPDDIPYPGGAPTPPYDNAGWTLAFQMGVEFDRILDPFSGPFEVLRGFAPVPQGVVAGAPTAAVAGTVAAAQWYAFERRTNDAFAAANRLLARGEEVYTIVDPQHIGGRALAPGTFLVNVRATTLPLLRSLASERGVVFSSLQGAPVPAGIVRLRQPRIALWDVYGGSMSSGWMRFVFDQFEFPYHVLYAGDLDRGGLASRYDVVILPDGATLAADSVVAGFESRFQPANVPAEWQPRLGRISVAKTLPQLRAFVEEGGTLLAIGDAANVAYGLGLPVTNAVVDSAGKQLSRAKYYVPGSVLGVSVDTTNVLAWGMRPRADVFFDNSPTFRLKPEAQAKGATAVAWFDSAAPLRSGWAWGQQVLDKAAPIVAAPVGRGTVILYGPEIHFRGQTHGAFPFLFNGIYYGQVPPRPRSTN